MRDLIINLWKKKKVFIISITICALVGGVIGGAVSRFRANAGQTEEQQVYEDNMEEYDSVLSELEDSITAAEEQVNTQEEYCEQSVFMQIDSANVQTAAVQYTFQGGDSSQGINILAAYVNDGALKSDIAGELGDIKSEYLDEIISCTTLNPTLTVTVMHYDMEQAVAIRDAIEINIEKRIDKLVGQLSNFSLVNTDMSQTVTVNSSVMNTQNTNLNNLKSYKSSLSDLQKKLVDQRTNRENYIENNEPDATSLVEEPFAITVLKYLLFGAIFGGVLPAAFYAFRYYQSDKLKGAEELMASGMPVLGQMTSGKDYNDVLEKSCVNIQILAEKNNCDTVALIKFGENKTWEEICKYYTENLTQSGITVVESSSEIDNLEEVREVSHIGHCILLVEKGKTTYQQLEEYRQFCSDLCITIWGCVISG